MSRMRSPADADDDEEVVAVTPGRGGSPPEVEEKARESVIVTEVVQERQSYSQTIDALPVIVPSSNNGPEVVRTSSVEEDCLTMTEVTELSTIDEITVDVDDLGEMEGEDNSCKTTASTLTAMSSVDTVEVSECPLVRRTSAREALVRTSYLRIVYQHCKVIIKQSKEYFHNSHCTECEINSESNLLLSLAFELI